MEGQATPGPPSRAPARQLTLPLPPGMASHSPPPSSAFRRRAGTLAAHFAAIRQLISELGGKFTLGARGA
jgi:hypothetical protein